MQTPETSEPPLEIVREILDYFLRNPKAADTVEGVARWRLLEEHVRRSLQQTEMALAWLVAQGFLEEATISGSSRIFRLDAAHQASGIQFLAQTQEQPGKKSF